VLEQLINNGCLDSIQPEKRIINGLALDMVVTDYRQELHETKKQWTKP
tara:strand:- start:518 stop:661 length:144 start_codon:yes stop_codon:yes gene_type:complete